MMIFESKKMGLLAGLDDADSRWTIVEGDDRECECGETCTCAQPNGFKKFVPESQEEVVNDLSEAELRKFIKNALKSF